MNKSRYSVSISNHKARIGPIVLVSDVGIAIKFAFLKFNFFVEVLFEIDRVIYCGL